MKKKTVFDLDNVICFTDKNKNYKKSKPFQKAIKTVNELYKKAIPLKYIQLEEWANLEMIISKKNYLKFTKNQLKKWELSITNYIYANLHMIYLSMTNVMATILIGLIMFKKFK